MNIFTEILRLQQEFNSWFFNFWLDIQVVFLNIYVAVLREWLDLVWSMLGTIPVPDALANFVWPDPGFIGSALILVGVPEAIAILSAAFVIKVSMRLLPLIMAA